MMYKFRAKRYRLLIMFLIIVAFLGFGKNAKAAEGRCFCYNSQEKNDIEAAIGKSYEEDYYSSLLNRADGFISSCYLSVKNKCDSEETDGFTCEYIAPVTGDEYYLENMCLSKGEQLEKKLVEDVKKMEKTVIDLKKRKSDDALQKQIQEFYL